MAKFLHPLVLIILTKHISNRK